MSFRINKLFLACAAVAALFTSVGRVDAGFIGIADTTLETTLLAGDLLFVNGTKSFFGTTPIVIPVSATPNAFAVSTTPVVVDVATLNVGHNGPTDAAGLGLTVVMDLTGTFAGHYTFLVQATATNSSNPKTWSIDSPQIFTITNGSGILTVQFNSDLAGHAPGELTATFTQTQAVPEPTSMALMGMGAVGTAIGAYRRRRANRNSAV